MISVGFDVAKDKLDCFIINSKGEVLAKDFTSKNNHKGFEVLLQCICQYADKSEKIKLEPEAI